MSQFDPTAKSKEKLEKSKKKKALADIQNWSLSLIPAGDLHQGIISTID